MFTASFTDTLIVFAQNYISPNTPNLNELSLSLETSSIKVVSTQLNSPAYPCKKGTRTPSIKIIERAKSEKNTEKKLFLKNYLGKEICRWLVTLPSSTVRLDSSSDKKNKND